MKSRLKCGSCEYYDKADIRADRFLLASRHVYSFRDFGWRSWAGKYSVCDFVYHIVQWKPTRQRDRLKHLPYLWRDLLLNVIRQGAIVAEGRGVVVFQKRKKRKKNTTILELQVRTKAYSCFRGIFYAAFFIILWSIYGRVRMLHCLTVREMAIWWLRGHSCWKVE